MAPIAKIAAAELPDTPELEPLRMPQDHPSIERLRAAALGMAKAAEPYAAVFIEAALPPDFIQRLIDAANTTVATVGARYLAAVFSAASSRWLSAARRWWLSSTKTFSLPNASWSWGRRSVGGARN